MVTQAGRERSRSESPAYESQSESGAGSARTVIATRTVSYGPGNAMIMMTGTPAAAVRRSLTGGPVSAPQAGQSPVIGAAAGPSSACQLPEWPGCQAGGSELGSVTASGPSASSQSRRPPELSQQNRT